MIDVKAFFDPQTSTLTYVVSDASTRDAVVIDPVLDFDLASGAKSTNSLDALARYVYEAKLKPQLILETHAHADHISGAQPLKSRYPDARVAISERIRLVQATMKSVLELPESFPTDGSQFDRLVKDDAPIRVGTLSFRFLPTPGHTEACASILFDGAVFTGDALFMPDSGTGRCDFPGGSARKLFQSIKTQLYSLPDATRVFTGHDYQPNERKLRYEATIGEQKLANIHVNAKTAEFEFVKMREGRDKTLNPPKLLDPSIRANLGGGGRL